MISFLSRTLDFFSFFLSLWIYLWLAETSQQPISQQPGRRSPLIVTILVNLYTGIIPSLQKTCISLKITAPSFKTRAHQGKHNTI
jgi:hypothetical protein